MKWLAIKCEVGQVLDDLVQLLKMLMSLVVME